MAELDWMHPSYRDLVIDELVTDKGLRINFLGTASIRDISLALSTIGGHDGKRTMPLIGDEESKKIVVERVKALFSTEDEFSLSNLLTILDYARKQNDSQSEWVTDLLYITLSSFPRLFAGKIIYSDLLDYYCKLTLDFKPLLPLPDFEPTWNYRVKLIKEVVDEQSYFIGSEIESWTKLISLLQKNEPRFLTQINFPTDYSALVIRVIKNLQTDVKYDICSPKKDDITTEIDRLNEIIDGLIELMSEVLEWKIIISPILSPLERKRDDLAESIPENQEPDFDDIDDEPIDPSGFDIDQLFSDL